MISLADVHLAFGAQTVLDEVNLTVTTDTRAGLVGANGSGKSSLLRILAGLQPPDGGTRTAAKDVRVTYLPQYAPPQSDEPVFTYCLRAFDQLDALSRKRDELSHQIGSAAQAQQIQLSQRISDIEDHLVFAGYYSREARVSRVLTGLGFKSRDNNSPLRTFSGGWRMRAELARRLLEAPDILLLDEPTNYLDLEIRKWLAEFLRGYDGGVVVVAHDRHFLDSVVESIYEVFQSRVKRYRGTFTQYEQARSEEIDRLVSAFHQQQRDIKKQEQFVQRFRAKASKARQVQSRIKMLEKTERIELPEHLKPISIKLPPATHSGRQVIQISSLTKRYGSKLVLKDLDLTLTRGRRLVVAGPNGAGKTTLLRIVAGNDHAYDGSCTLGKDVVLSYYSQESADSLPPEESIIDYCSNRLSRDRATHVRDLLGSFLFSGDAVDKPLGVLSGGERARVVMASLLASPANLLILDEPTNHLDLVSQRVLATALKQYEGTVVLVSHDLYFLREVSTDVLELWPADTDGGNWYLYPGDFRSFEQGGSRAPGSAKLDGSSTSDTGRQRPTTASGGKSPASGSAEMATGGTPSSDDSYQQFKELRSKVRRLERQEHSVMEQIEILESRLSELQHELADPEVYKNGERVKEVQEAIASTNADLTESHKDWEEISAELRQCQATINGNN